ncbi:MAG: TonB-dependent receptor [Bacteroidota bacterium]
MKKQFIYSLLLVLLSLQVMAQSKITGKVTDSKDGSGLPGVTVAVKGVPGGTQTDVNGAFSIDVADQASAVLVFTYLGYASQEIPAAGKTAIDVKLVESAKTIDEVVVIGYGTSKKSDLTGAISSVKSERLNDRPVPNVTQALQGKVAGVDVSVNSNAPGAGAKVRIRGIGSIASSTDPLYVVDGVIGVDPNTINPNDIASVEVQKDATSTAIYGVRGANGVILVTTKRGRTNGTAISYEWNGNISENYRHMPTLNARQFIDVYNQAFANGAKFDPTGQIQTPPKALNYANYPLLFDVNNNPLYDTNWEKETWKPAFSQNHQLNIQGGNEQSQYSLSLGYLDQKGLAPTSGFKRYSVKVTMDNKLKSWLTVGGNINAIQSRQRMVTDGNGGLNVPRSVIESAPIIPIRYPNGTYAGSFDLAGQEGIPNPIHIANDRFTLNNTTQILGNIYFNFKITNELEFKTDFGYNLNNRKNNFYAGQTLQHLSADQGGIANINAFADTYWQSENYLTWNKKINEKNRFTALLGFSLNQFSFERVRSETQNFVSDYTLFNNLSAGSLRSAAESDAQSNQLNSVYGRFSYTLDEKYLFTATGRYDGSSRFGSKNKFSFFPSAGFGWRVSQEDFLKDNATISNLKLRVSAGVTGNQEFANFRSLPQFNTAQTAQNGAAVISLLPGYIGNDDLKWERTTQYDAGLELGLFGDRVNMEIDYYNRTTNDLLLQAPIPWSAGYTTSNVYRNIGSVRNSGFELSLNTTNIKSDNFQWNTTFLATINRNKVLKLNEGNADIFPGPNFLGQNYVIRVGQPLGSFYGQTRLGTYGDSPEETALAASRGFKPGDRKYLYTNGQPDLRVIGQAYPKWTGNFNSTMRYKNWDFSFDIRFVQGVNTAANFKHSAEDRQTIANSLSTVLNAWTPGNQNTMISQVRNYKYAQDSKFDTWWVEDGSFIRGQNFLLGYNFNDALVKKLNMNRLRVYASVQNLFIITKYTGYDPEVDTYNSGYGSNSNLSQGLDFFSIPRPRIWNLGVQVGF